ncbi:hypothetical protein ACQPZZ_18070 [Microbispora sp. CA-135349]|uniref:hypothetical protein n=1 Tax=Microbispora sp. CA-135349 TaxID=3239953 RepID=UPI003D8E1D1B
MAVVFDRATRHGSDQEEGVAGVLELRESPAGPVGLFPDPQAMAGACGNGPAFAASLANAWHASPWRDRGRCVLWRVAVHDHATRALRISGGSLGAAFALGLRELFRHPRARRPGAAALRGLVYGLRSRTAVTGRVEETGTLRHVSGLSAKLRVAQSKHWRLVVPEENRGDVPGRPAAVRFAVNLRQADRYARQWRVGRLATAAMVLAVAGATGVVVAKVDAAAAERRHTATRLSEVSRTLLDRDVGLAQLFAAEAYHYDATRRPEPPCSTRCRPAPTSYAVCRQAGRIQADGCGRLAVGAVRGRLRRQRGRPPFPLSSCCST